jgi:hypothetical protein
MLKVRGYAPLLGGDAILQSFYSWSFPRKTLINPDWKNRSTIYRGKGFAPQPSYCCKLSFLS